MHVAGRLVRSGRRLILSLDKDWPWTADLADAFNRLRAAPWPGWPTPPSAHHQDLGEQPTRHAGPLPHAPTVSRHPEPRSVALPDETGRVMKRPG
ncbi:MAG: hypothetical protein DLM59_09220 [Pseudonocardiales bacterium]|nr:MAG: hypothetical protein DLM59_09220 [Pseudonocardiales bacterium]